MTTTIKITELTDIGANLASSTVLPVVNMSGTPTTQKTVLGNIANVILEGAGTDYSPVASAGIAVVAGTVTTHAQPNITSVGTLTGITSTGTANFTSASNVSLGPVANVHITGGTNGQVLTTDGSGTLSWSTVSGGNANTGDLSFTGNAMYNLGGAIVENADLTHGATSALVIPANGNTTAPVQITNTYGNIVMTTGINAGQLKNWTFDNTGNVTLPANSFAVKYANGTQVPLDSVQSKIANGTSNVNIAASGGNVTVNAGSSHLWTFGTDGTLTTPGNIVGPANANLVIYANAGVHDFIFGDDGTFYAPDNVVLSGSRISMGPGAANLASLTNAVFIASTTGDAYIQAVIENVSDNGSADWVALGHRGNDDGGWADMGFTSSGFNDANYTITGQGDGYVFVQTFYDGQVLGSTRGGNLVLATGENGTVNDIIFGTGGFATSDIFGRISNANNALELSRTNSNINLSGGGGIIGAGNLNLQPDPGNSGSYLDIFLTSGPDLHLVASAAANLILGKDDGPNVMTSWDGNVYVQSWNTSSNTQGGVWNFGEDGNLTAPGAINVGNMSIGTLPGYITANANTGIILNTSGSDGGFVVDYLKEDGNANTTGGELAFSSETGNATYRISLSDDLGDGFATKIWRFDGTGNLVLAGGNSVIYSIANSSLDPTNPNVSTMTLTPDANYNSQVLVLDPTAPGHIHLRAYAFSNIDEPAANIFLGGEDTAFEITSGANNEARIHSNNYTWTFGNDGALSFPRDAVGNTDPYLVITGGPAPAISSVDVSLAGPANLQLVSDYLNLTGYTGAKVVVRADDGEIMADANMVLTTNAANIGNEFSWTFATDGSLTLPGNLISSGASPAPSISGFSSISTLVSLNTPVAYSALTAVAGSRAFINDANLVAAGNFGQQVSGGGANSTPVWSDGTNWYIG